MTVWEPDSDPVDFKEGADGKEKVAAATTRASSVDRDRVFIICILVYILLLLGTVFTLLIMIYMEKQKPCQCQL